jgi:hypothetical protein
MKILEFYDRLLCSSWMKVFYISRSIKVLKFHYSSWYLFPNLLLPLSRCEGLTIIDCKYEQLNLNLKTIH